MTIYLNNAATSWPKPAEVTEAIRAAQEEIHADPGHSDGDDDMTFECLHILSRLFNIRDLNKIVLTPSSTYATNRIIRSLLLERPGAHCVTTTFEHTSILSPLEDLGKSHDIETTFVEPCSGGRLDPDEILSAIRPETALIAVSHVTNVTGCIQPIEEIAALAAEAEIPMLIDASQSAGAIYLDFDALPGRTFVSFAGHKGLFGPTGVGGLLVPDADFSVKSVCTEGVEAETMSLSGIAGLTAGVQFVREQGLLNLGKHRNQLVQLLRNRLCEIDEVRLSPLAGEDGSAGIVSFAVKGYSSEELSLLLEESFEIETLSDLHGAPRNQSSMGVYPEGSVRVSVSAFNTPQDMENLARTVRHAVQSACVM